MKTVLAWLGAIAYTVAVLALWLCWPQVATWASQFGWPRESFLNQSAQAAFWAPGGMLLLLAWIGVLFATLSAIIDGNTEEQKRLRKQDARANELNDELNTCQAKLTLEQLERTRYFEQCTKHIDEIRHLKAQLELERALGRPKEPTLAGQAQSTANVFSQLRGGGGGGGRGCTLPIRAVRKEQSDSEKEAAILIADFGRDKAAEISISVLDYLEAEHLPQHARVGGSVPYRIKAEPLKISDLREGDEVICKMDDETGCLYQGGLWHSGQFDGDWVNVRLSDGKIRQVNPSLVVGVLRRIGS